MIGCPTNEQLEEFLAEGLTPAATAQLEAHIEKCAQCLDSLARLSQETCQGSDFDFPRPSTGNSITDEINPDFLARMKNRQFHPTVLPGSARPFNSMTNQLQTEYLLPGVPGYEVLEEIGRGGMGVVYKAKHLGLKRLVALKMLLGSRFESHEGRQRFRREAEAIGRLQHPNIVQVYDFGETDAGPFFSLELMESGSLSRRLDGTPWNAAAAAGFVERLAWAIQFAHERGIVHRDLKPANILLQSGSGERSKESLTKSTDSSVKQHASLYVPKIGDFGLAKFIGDDDQQTANGKILGTPSYLAPEQTNSNLGTIGPATDVYGLGAILYELLTGWPPFKGDSVMSTLLLVTHQEPVRPSRLNVKIPRDLETICLKCLEKSPVKRYASAGLLAEDLHRFLAGENVLARPVSLPQKVWRWCRRTPVVAGLLAGICLVTLIGMIGITTAWQSAEQGWNRARIALDREILVNQKLDDQKTKTENALYVQKLSLAHHEWLSFNVGRANELLAECPLDQRSWEWQYLHRLCNDEVVSLKEHKLPVAGVAFSPDGQRIVTVTGIWPVNHLRDEAPLIHEPGEVRVWEAASGTELFACRGHRGAVMGVAFSPDAKQIATASFDQTARLWVATTGEEQFVLNCSGGWVHSVAFSPDGGRLATSSGNVIQLWDTVNGQELLSLHGHADSVHSVAFTPDGQRLVSGSRDWTVKVWNCNQGQRGRVTVSERTIAGPGDVRTVAVSPDGRRIVAGGFDGVVKVFELATGVEIVTQRSHATNITSVAFSPDSRRVVSTDSEGRVLLWDAATTDHLLVIRGHAGGVFSTAFRSDGRHLITGGTDGTAKVWDITSEQSFRELTPKRGSFRQLRFSPDSRQLAAAVIVRGEQMSGEIWSLKSRQSLPLRSGYASGKGAISFHPSGTSLATASADNTVKIWSTKDGKNIETLKGHTDRVTSVAYSPDGRWIASGSADKTVRIWDAATIHSEVAARLSEVIKSLPKTIAQAIPAFRDLMPERTLTNETAGVDVVAFSPTSRWLAVGGNDGLIRLLNIPDGEEILTLEPLPGSLSSLEISPDGSRIAAACRDHYPRVWTIFQDPDGLLKASSARLFNGHIDKVFSVAFSADGRRLASVSLDNTVRIWDIASGQETIALRAPGNGVTAVAFSPNGHTLATGFSNVKLWETTLPDRNAPEWIEAWHRDEFESAQKEHDWFASIFHLSRLLEINGNSAETYRQRGELYLFLREWALAAADFTRILEINGDSPEIFRKRGELFLFLREWALASADFTRFLESQPGNLDVQFRRAGASLLVDDHQGYREVQSVIQSRFGGTSSKIPAYYVIRIGTLKSQAPEQNEHLLQLAEQVLASTSAPTPHLDYGAELHAIAMARFRAGRFHDAIQTAQASLSVEPRWNAREINRFVLAMALHEIGKTDDANREFETAKEWMEKATKLPTNQNPHILGLHPNDWLAILLLRNESEKLLGIVK